MLVFLSQETYLNLLAKQKDPTKRMAMKQKAHSAMYGSDRSARVPQDTRDLPDIGETNGQQQCTDSDPRESESQGQEARAKGD